MKISVSRTVSSGRETITQTAEVECSFEHLAVGRENECLGLIAATLLEAIGGTGHQAGDCELYAPPSSRN